MGFKEKLEQYQRDTFMEQYGDRISPIMGNLLSVKISSFAVKTAKPFSSSGFADSCV